MKPTPYISWMYKRATIGIPDGDSDGVPGIGQELLYLLLLGLAYQLILIFLELGFIERLLGLMFRTKTDAFLKKSDDEDVELEAHRVAQLVRDGKCKFVVQLQRHVALITPF